jgi:hypothetical protein
MTFMAKLPEIAAQTYVGRRSLASHGYAKGTHISPHAFLILLMKTAMPNQRRREYPVHEDAVFQARTWALQRVAWVVLTVIPVLALFGLFAHGVLSEQTAGDNATLAIEYQRFQRVTDLTRFVVRVADAQGELRLAPPFQETYEIESIQPQPTRSIAGPEGLLLRFDKPPVGVLIAVIWARPRQFGYFTMRAQHGETSIPFNVLIYP